MREKRKYDHSCKGCKLEIDIISPDLVKQGIMRDASNVEMERPAEMQEIRYRDETFQEDLGRAMGGFRKRRCKGYRGWMTQAGV